MPKVKPNKSGARHSSSDQGHLDQAAAHLMQAGADFPGGAEQAAGKSLALKFMAMPMTGDAMLSFAAQEGLDAQSAAFALATICGLVASEASETMEDADDVRDVAQLAGVARSLMTFIGGELDEAVSAAGQQSDQPDTAPLDPNFPSKALSINYIKALHIPHAEQFYRDVVAVKSIGDDTIRGYSMLWGAADLVDVERDFFTAKSDFWDSSFAGQVRPLTWDHGQDPATKSAPLIGEIVEFGDDAVGRWYNAQLNRSAQYRKAIDKLVSQREVGTSSDSAPQYVIRERAKSGAMWLKQWPWFASALTPTPCEPRMFSDGSVYWKSIGVVLPAGGNRVGDAMLREYELLKLVG